MECGDKPRWKRKEVEAGRHSKERHYKTIVVEKNALE